MFVSVEAAEEALRELLTICRSLLDEQGSQEGDVTYDVTILCNDPSEDSD